MSSAPLVSIIIPCYNYGKFLGEAIESAINQTYPNIEIIVVDDGSTDATSSVALKYIHKFGNVRYIFQKHSGVAKAMNNGIKKSRGNFTMPLGADDILAPTYVERCLKEFHDKKVGFVWTATKFFGLCTKVDYSVFKQLNRFNVLIPVGGQLGGMLIKRKAFDQVGGFDPRLKAYEDWDLAIRLVLSGWKGVYVHEPIYFYRIHGSHQRNAEFSKTKEAYRQLCQRYPLMYPTNLLWKFFFKPLFYKLRYITS
jgi:glycosyltransferase involved in cell wall biosynthesis